MRRVTAIVVGLAVLTGGEGLAAKAPKLTLPLVPAYCAGTPPVACNPAFAFKTGTAVLTAAKEPGPTCPRTGKPSETPGGSVTLAGVTRGGAPYSGALAVEVTNQTTFGSDAGNCPLNDIQITLVTLAGTLTCQNGRCKGLILPIACLPKECADVPITTEFGALEVLDAPSVEGGRPFARPGLFVVPGK